MQGSGREDYHIAIIVQDLSSSQLHRSVKPSIFSCFGDIALATGESFDKYLMYVMPMLQSAAELSFDQRVLMMN